MLKMMKIKRKNREGEEEKEKKIKNQIWVVPLLKKQKLVRDI